MWKGRTYTFFMSTTKPEMTETHTHDLREDNGQYAVGMDRLCVCGHKKGSHTYGRRGGEGGQCIACDVEQDAPGAMECECMKFKAAPRSKTKK